MTEKINLGLLFGGRSGEHAVSLMSSRSVLSVLDPDKYQVFQIGITQAGLWLSGPDALTAFEKDKTEGLLPVLLLSDEGKTKLYSRDGAQLNFIAELDVIFPVLHGSFGEDGTMQGLLEMQNCAYVGAGVLASSVGMDKSICKDVVQNAGVPVLAYTVFRRSEIHNSLDEVIALSEAVAAYPLFVKPANMGSSVGISKANKREELIQALHKAAKFDRRVLVERGLNAREIEISVLGNDMPVCSIPGEIVPDDEFYTYKDKYFNNQPRLLIPAPLSHAQTEQVQEYALRVYRALDGAGMSRVDFLMDKDSDAIYFSEINTIPGFTKISMYPKLWQASGLSYADLVDRLIELALDRKADQDATQRSYED